MVVAVKTATIPIGGAPFVNLIPPSETTRRQTIRLFKRWAAAVVAVVVLVAIATAGAFWLQLTASQRLVAETARTQSLLTQLSELSPVQAQLDLQSELTAFRSDAMATDLRYSALVSSIAGVLPAGSAVSGFTLAPAGMPQGEDPALEVGAAGSVTIASPGPQEVVPIVRAIRALPGVMEADGWEIGAADGGYTYEVRVAFDQSVYTGEFAEEDAE